MAASEDSDATVGAASEEEDEEHSPSFLLPRSASIRTGKSSVTDQVPCSSEEEMSEEFPPPGVVWPIKPCIHPPALPGLKSTQASQSLRQTQTGRTVDGSAKQFVREKRAPEKPASDGQVERKAVEEPSNGSRKRDSGSGETEVAEITEPGATISLADVSRLQSILLTDIEDFPGTQSSSTVLQRKAEKVEGHLKTLNEANQLERKRLAEAHKAVLSGSSPVVESSQSIKEQLVGLASAQKQLLKLFIRQKEIAKQLSVLQIQPVRKGSDSNTHTRVKAGHSSQKSMAQPHSEIRELCRPNHESGKDLSSTSITSQPIASLTQSHVQSPSPIHAYSQLTSLSQPSKPAAIAIVQSHPQPLTHLNTPPPALQSPPQPTVLAQPPAQPPAPAQPPTSCLPTAELAQPVPLEILIQHSFILPKENALSCTLMGCVFHAGLLQDGQIESESKKRYPDPVKWMTACWAALGHQKKVTRKQSYKLVLYNGAPLMQYCQKYSIQRVSCYLSHKQVVASQQGTPNSHGLSTQPFPALVNKEPLLPSDLSTISNTASRTSKNFPISELVADGRVFLVDAYASVDLPKGFWEDEGYKWTPQLNQSLCTDLDW